MSIRWTLTAVVLSAGLLGLTVGGLGQDPKKADGPPGEAPKEETFDTVDGVALRGVFYRATNPKQSAAATPVVLVLHSYKGGPYQSKQHEAKAKADFEKEEEAWDSACKQIQSKGWHAFRFDFRGHGKSTRVTAKEFYDPAQPWGRINQKTTRLPAGATTATQTTLEAKDFKAEYYPMLVQDIAAARTHLDKKNDNGEVNTSSLYLLGSGDAVNLGLFWTVSEWNRERRRPNSDFIDQRVYPGRGRLRADTEWAALDIRGAMWLSPAPAPGNSISPADIGRWVISPYALETRVETQMAFLYGDGDSRSAQVTKALCDRMKIVPKDAFNPPKPGAREPKLVGPNGKPIPNPERTFYGAIKGTKLTGTGLLGNNLGTEKLLGDFVTDVEELRRGRERIGDRGWTRPLYIDIVQYGVGRY